MYCTKSNSLIGFLLLLLYFYFTICFSSGADTLYANQSLSGDQIIISKGENFAMGFFKPGDSSNYYIGIWYKKVSSNPPTIVWVANRETPVFDRFKSQLKMVDGNLVLLNESNFQIWSTNVTTNSKYATVVIRDDGNLVLRDGLSSVWQSFDHPLDTWLPGSKLGYDYITKTSQFLTSWKNKEDPGVGLFSFELDRSQKQYVSKWNRSKQYWTSGSWNGSIFSLVPIMRVNHIYNFSFFSNENESYVTYFVRSPFIISRFIMDVSGLVQQQTWSESEKLWKSFWSQPKTQCEMSDIYSFCGTFGTCRQTGQFASCSCLTGFKPRLEMDWNRSDFSEGCMRKTDLQCGRNTDFLMITVTRLPPNNNNLVAVASARECHTEEFSFY